MKQAHLSGNIKGLRPSQQRRLEVLLYRRHPTDQVADQCALEQLADEVMGVNHALHSIIDNRGLCRLLWVGPLDQSRPILSYIPEAQRRTKKDWRLISCSKNFHEQELNLDLKDSIVALDLSPVFWLRFSPIFNSDGKRQASIWFPDAKVHQGWSLSETSDLGSVCLRDYSVGDIEEKDLLPSVDSRRRVLLLTLTGQDLSRSERDLAELEGLVRSAGANPVAVARQKQGTFNPQTIWGTGKLQEVAFEVRRYQANLVITDRELTPNQLRNLERLLACSVIDRSELILDIFAQRASTATGRLQVELAQLRYRKSRLIGRGKSLSRQGGGIGTRGPGEKQLEKDRRSIVNRIQRLGNDLKEITKHRSRLRKRRIGIPRVALVGYTNVGKSTLMNALCNLNSSSQVVVENKLFATLDPTTRRLIMPQNASPPRELLITDTVGFIRDLPEPLMEAFRATLEETLEADLLLLMVDLSNPDWKYQLDTVNHLLDSLEVFSPRQIIANKIDCCNSSSLEEIRTVDKNVIYVSATSGAGLNGLKLSLQDQFWDIAPDSLLVRHKRIKHE